MWKNEIKTRQREKKINEKVKQNKTNKQTKNKRGKGKWKKFYKYKKADNWKKNVSERNNVGKTKRKVKVEKYKREKIEKMTKQKINVLCRLLVLPFFFFGFNLRPFWGSFERYRIPFPRERYQAE